MITAYRKMVKKYKEMIDLFENIKNGKKKKRQIINNLKLIQ